MFLYGKNYSHYSTEQRIYMAISIMSLSMPALAHEPITCLCSLTKTAMRLSRQASFSTSASRVPSTPLLWRFSTYGDKKRGIASLSQVPQPAYSAFEPLTMLRLSTVSSVSGELLLRGLKQPSSRPRSESIPWHQAGQIAIYSRL
ncbi:hypothetical protein FOTG_18719 [Fusarium oxysporum f. sp. vasinfectum 25433]|uniref:Uncharacterized protein n=1 Tax=Fusarium oxysporum f. sp. vasinfectum 25433 TaxID=1089449 RepID=X0KH54_FUSOX|nr:hypothetical protein FOTG_18719 [Fusarium oxysporum f. sp. vasinfectum 25433]